MTLPATEVVGNRGDGGAAGSSQHAVDAREAVGSDEVFLGEADRALQERLHDRGPSRLPALVLDGEQSRHLLSAQPGEPGAEVARIRHVETGHPHTEPVAPIHHGGEPLEIQDGHVIGPRPERVRDRDAHPLWIQGGDVGGNHVTLPGHRQRQVERHREERRCPIADARSHEREQRIVGADDLQDQQLGRGRRPDDRSRARAPAAGNVAEARDGVDAGGRRQDGCEQRRGAAPPSGRAPRDPGRHRHQRYSPAFSM